MSFLESALKLAKAGFYVFPLGPNSKLPIFESYTERATQDPEQIKKWWTDPVMGVEQPYNIGFITTRSSHGPLVIVDVDNKEGKDGDSTVLKLELEGKTFPKTCTQKTATRGRHLIYGAKYPVKQGSHVLGRDVDIRSRGGYVVGAGSVIDGRVYEIDRDAKPVQAPEWIIEACGKTKEETKIQEKEIINAPSAMDRAIDFLKKAPVAIQGEGGDQLTFHTICKIKDLGVPVETALAVLDPWNEKCVPPWEINDLVTKIKNAYRYGQNTVGVSSPEADFEEIEDDTPIVPEKVDEILKFNKEYAYAITGSAGHILWETTDESGGFRLKHIPLQSFHQYFASHTVFGAGDKPIPATQLWMRSKKRRTYDGICFAPEQKVNPRFYNLWRGFAVKPYDDIQQGSSTEQSALAKFVDHSYENICNKDEALHNWLMTYFAHMIQKPWEKPLVALVFKGDKGVGKNALVDRVAHLLGNHALTTSNSRYLLGNFNSHLENLLLFTLDEAFWSGDKKAEGVLKDLITGSKHVIEHKGSEPYTVKNCTRIVIIGNEEWIVPTSSDERRFAVFNVGNGKKQNRAYFQSMREGMERGGYRLLLRYLLDFNITKYDVNDAPRTEGLLDQKINGLDTLDQWLFESLTQGGLAPSGSEWPQEISKELVRQNIKKYCFERNIGSRLPNESYIGRKLKKVMPSLDLNHKVKTDDGRRNSYRFPSLEQARREFNTHIGHSVPWPAN